MVKNLPIKCQKWARKLRKNQKKWAWHYFAIGNNKYLFNEKF